MAFFRQLPRRTVLKGFGATIALPFLDAMTPAFARSAVSDVPPRMACVYVPNGIVMRDWTPTSQGPPDTAASRSIRPLPDSMPRILSPLEPYRDDISLLSGLTHNGGRALGDGPGDHARAGASFLTGVHPRKTYGADIHAGVSADQMVARHVGEATRFPSLEVGCEPGLLGGNCDSGYSCAYSNSISWRTPSAPMPVEANPRAVFERLFGPADDVADPAIAAKRRRYEESVLDVVLDDARRLDGLLGATDRRKLDEYLFSVRDIEKRLARAETERDVAPPDIERPPAGIPRDFAEHARLMSDLIAAAFQTDTTRVVTFMFGTELSNRVYREIGVTEAHHGLTHHRGDPTKIEKITQINRFHVEQFAYLLERLRATRDGDGSLLDQSTVIYGGGISDGNRHDHHDLPIVVAGQGHGHLRPGRHITYAPDTPMANLLLTVMDTMEVPVETLGDSTGRLESLSEL